MRDTDVISIPSDEVELVEIRRGAHGEDKVGWGDMAHEVLHFA